MRQLLFIDTETGGLDPRKKSIISLGAVLWQKRKLADRFEVYIREPRISCDAEAKAVHKIGLDWLKKHGETPERAVELFESFLKEHFSFTGDRPPIMLAGHNVGFDIAFLKRLYAFTDLAFSERFLHRSLDTCSVLAFLIDANVVPLDAPKSDLAFKYFKIKFQPGMRHRALGDAVATAKLYNRMLGLVSPPQRRKKK